MNAAGMKRATNVLTTRLGTACAAGFLLLLAGCGEDKDPNPLIGGPGTPSIWFASVPPIGNTTDLLRGGVSHVKPLDHSVVVYIFVSGLGWWVKPYYDRPLTPIDRHGNWSCDIVTGGIDEQATGVAAFLIPQNYNPPLYLGEARLGQELFDNSLVHVQTNRVGMALSRSQPLTADPAIQTEVESPQADVIELRICHAVDDTLVITWQAPGLVCALQETVDVGGTDWVDVTNPVEIVGTLSRVSLTQVAGNRFYRLGRPANPHSGSQANPAAHPRLQLHGGSMNEAFRASSSAMSRIASASVEGDVDAEPATCIRSSRSRRFQADESVGSRLHEGDRAMPPTTSQLAEDLRAGCTPSSGDAVENDAPPARIVVCVAATVVALVGGAAGWLGCLGPPRGR